MPETGRPTLHNLNLTTHTNYDILYTSNEREDNHYD